MTTKMKTRRHGDVVFLRSYPGRLFVAREMVDGTTWAAAADGGRELVRLDPTEVERAADVVLRLLRTDRELAMVRLRQVPLADAMEVALRLPYDDVTEVLAVLRAEVRA